MDVTESNLPPEAPIEKRRTNGQLVSLLGMLAVGMFVFAVFILPPLYEVFCEITGLNGRTDNLARKSIATLTNQVEGDAETSGGQATSDEVAADITPTHVGSVNGPVTIQFLADKHEDIPWTFEPTVFSMKLEPGKRYRTTFKVKNLSSETITGQAVPSVSPGYMAQYLSKMECFCFSQQTLEGNEAKEMPLSFSLSEDAPKDVSTLTLSYMLYNSKQGE